MPTNTILFFSFADEPLCGPPAGCKLAGLRDFQTFIHSSSYSCCGYSAATVVSVLAVSVGSMRYMPSPAVLLVRGSATSVEGFSELVDGSAGASTGSAGAVTVVSLSLASPSGALAIIALLANTLLIETIANVANAAKNNFFII